MRTLSIFALPFFLIGIALAADPEPAPPTLDLNVKIITLRTDGIVGYMREALGWSSAEVPLPKKDQTILITGHPGQDQLADGDVINITVTPTGPVKLPGGTIRSYRYLADYSLQ